jgi:endonuclease/exonuclease/phosphatase family metal-dependent hydrolase
MKRVIVLIALCFVLGGINAQSLFVGTYNIRNDNKGDVKHGNGWTLRCPVICDMMNFEQPDLFGSQEVLASQIHDMLAKLDGYGYIGVGRTDGKEGGEYSPIFYKKSKFKLLKSNTFWLSEYPDSVGRKGWDAALPRICTWGHFMDVKTKFQFYFFNLHMDHIGVVARRESAKLVVSMIKKICKGAPVILTGDFNVDQKNEIYTIFSNSGILKDSYVYAKRRFAENGSFNNFDPTTKTVSRIDHIFLSPGFVINNYGILTNGYWTPVENSSPLRGKDAPTEIDLVPSQHRTPSDHYPVLARIVYDKKVKK